ncbi:MAG: DNA methyltransferase [Candidatus Poribacteria bacterium]|nr:DNA methyltransferase [Candidatus Poribacteria bacterium]
MPAPNFQNRTLYHGDNLAFLRGMNSETVHLVATDPPFNKSRDFHATPDSLAAGASFQDRWSWRDDIHDEWLTKIRDDHPEVWNAVMAAKKVYGDDLAAYLCFMGVRVIEMHRVLRHDGSLYLHCDPTASHYLKMLLDAVFGHANFRNEIVWKRTLGRGDGKRYGRIHDILLFYTKSKTYTWKNVYVDDPEYIRKTFRYSDDRGKYRRTDLTGPGVSSGKSGEPYKGYDPTKIGRCWSVPKTGNYAEWIDQNVIPGFREIASIHERLEKLEKEDMIEWSKSGTPNIKQYADAYPGTKVNDLFFDIPPVSRNRRTGYPTQKPLDLYMRIIGASSNEGDMVLDPFCGCATTLVAAEKLKRQWVGMDIWNEAHDLVLSEFAKEGLAADEVNPDLERQGRFGFDAVHYETEPPKRTDGVDETAAYIQTPTGRKRPRHPSPRSQHGKLLEQFGAFCQGCGRDYRFDPRVLEVDHIRPKSDGGSDAYDNLTLLCPPCNRVKMDRMTLTGLQIQNRRDGHLLRENDPNLKLGRGAPKRRR